jgi:hypothetical protein
MGSSSKLLAVLPPLLLLVLVLTVMVRVRALIGFIFLFLMLCVEVCSANDGDHFRLPGRAMS